MVVLFWILVATGVAYAMLAAWRVSLGTGRDRAPTLVLAFVGMAAWAVSGLSQDLLLIVGAQLFRNLAWLVYLANATHPFADSSGRRTHSATVLGALSVFGAVAAVMGLIQAPETPGAMTWALVTIACRLLLAIGFIIYLHNLYNGLTSNSGTGFRLILFALGMLNAYDLNLYTVGLLGYHVAEPLSIGRPVLALLLVPLFLVAARRREHWKIALSRKATFQSLSLVAIGLYFVSMSIVARSGTTLETAAGPAIAIGAVLALSALGAIVLFSSRTRAWLKVIIVKNLFRHRYDYRAEWLRFSATISDSKGSALSLEERVVKAVADVTESPAGLLLMTSDQHAFDVAAAWSWGHRAMPGNGVVRFPEVERAQLQQGLITTLDPETRNTFAASDQTDDSEAIGDAWVAVPLIWLSTMIGVVILAKPRLARALDWEDFDLLKVIGQQAAVHLSDAHKQLELEEARRFEEFNRRFAYIIHDIKNVVSQLSLLASNAQQHGSNPKFQAEMSRSLTSAVQKMNVLLARLSPDRVLQSATPESIDIDRLIDTVVTGRVDQRSLSIGLRSGAQARGDLEKLKLALDHLVQNAIEASPADQPVVVSATAENRQCLITVADKGIGMSADFIRKGLFKPFVSTKGGGFGIGAAEAKALVTGMGGSLRVTSTEGHGSVFTIELPLSDVRD
ncbi:XrtA/PEP-CTERM system histidine kinase PrsK [Sphingomonas echinoides]|uniref:XrtA/PEP-CTERM system histidine kinase PrsK n=1 Tax=Sphingomonas echinoides TaxID=59803 RepID=UPI0024134D7F|nr:XrtA/PEP-CTERM system histidine kinase PrsK [Sphingomonas echinoides]